jgi:hypothetical protein
MITGFNGDPHDVRGPGHSRASVEVDDERRIAGKPLRDEHSAVTGDERWDVGPATDGRRSGEPHRHAEPNVITKLRERPGASCGQRIEFEAPQRPHIGNG